MVLKATKFQYYLLKLSYVVGEGICIDVQCLSFEIGQKLIRINTLQNR